MANWSNPTNTTTYLDVLNELKSRDEDSLTLMNKPGTNIPSKTIRFLRRAGNNKVAIQEWNGSSWITKVVESNSIDVGSLGTMSSQNSNAVSITGGSVAASTLQGALPSGTLPVKTSLLDYVDPSSESDDSVPSAKVVASAIKRASETSWAFLGRYTFIDTGPGSGQFRNYNNNIVAIDWIDSDLRDAETDIKEILVGGRLIIFDLTRIVSVFNVTGIKHFTGTTRSSIVAPASTDFTKLKIGTSYRIYWDPFYRQVAEYDIPDDLISSRLIADGAVGSAKLAGLIASDIPNLNASKITSGTLDAARVPNLIHDLSLESIDSTDRIPFSDENVSGDPDKSITFANFKSALNIPSAALGFHLHNNVSSALSSGQIANDDRLLISDVSVTGEPNKYISAGGLQNYIMNEMTASDIPDLSASQIPNLNASKINAGTLNVARIPDLNASKINAGTLDAARIPNLIHDLSLESIDSTDRIPFSDENVSGDPDKSITFANFKSALNIPSAALGFHLHNNVSSALSSGQIANDDRLLISDVSVTGEPNKYISAGGLQNYIMNEMTASDIPDLSASQIPNLNASKINAGTLNVARIPNLSADKITSGTLDAARIPNLNASKINAGTLNVARVPNLSADKITSGTLDAARIPSLAASKITSGTLNAARLGSGSGNSKFLRRDGIWADPPVGVGSSIDLNNIAITGGTVSGISSLGVTGNTTTGGSLITGTDSVNLTDAEGRIPRENITRLFEGTNVGKSVLVLDYILLAKSAVLSVPRIKQVNYNRIVIGVKGSVWSPANIESIGSYYEGALIFKVENPIGTEVAVGYITKVTATGVTNVSVGLDVITFLGEDVVDKSSNPDFGVTGDIIRFSFYRKRFAVDDISNLSASQIPNLSASKITSGTLNAARIPSLAASKITSGTLDVARIPNLIHDLSLESIDSTDRIPFSDENVSGDPDKSITFANFKSALNIPSAALGFHLHNNVSSALSSGQIANDDRLLISDVSVTGEPNKYISAGGLQNYIMNEMTASDIPDLSASQIPDLTASKITSGTLNAARIPSLAASKITSGTLDVARIPNLIHDLSLESIDSTDRIPFSDENVSGDPDKSITFANFKSALNIPSAALGFHLHNNVSSALSSGQIANDDRLLISDVSVTGEPNKYISAGGLQNYIMNEMTASDIPDLSASQIPNLNASKINAGTLNVARIPDLNASKINAGTLDAARIPNLNASKINAGTLNAARIPSLTASKITSGTLDAARIPSLNASKITSGTLDVARIPNLIHDLSLESIDSTDRIPFSDENVSGDPDKSITFANFKSALNIPSAALGFHLHNNVSTALTSGQIANDDRLLISDESTTGDPNKYISAGGLQNYIMNEMTASDIPDLSASQIPNLSASKITSGTLNAARIPSLNASKITSGTLAYQRLPNNNNARSQLGLGSAATEDTADPLEAVNASPISLNSGRALTNGRLYSTTITIPTSGQLLVLAALVKSRSSDSTPPGGVVISNPFFRSSLLATTVSTAGSDGGSGSDYITFSGSGISLFGLKLQRTSTNELLMFFNSAFVGKGLVTNITLYKVRQALG